jgi:HAD superfamily hydrolase (TIGR01509 family)
MKIKLAIFDGEGVIYNSKKVVKEFKKEYDSFLRKFGVSFKEQEKLWFKFYPKALKGKLTLRESDEIIYKKLGIPKSKVKEWLKKDRHLNLKFVKIIKGAKKILLETKAKGIKVAILSNTVHPLKWRLDLYKKLRLVKGKHYDKLFLSNMIGYKKPEKEAYLTVLKYFEVKPKEAVFVGHDKKELEGARKVGIKALTLSQYKRFLWRIK